MKPIPSLINRIINHTILPKSGNFDAVRGHVWNIMEFILEGKKFDVIDVIIRGIVSSKNDRIKRIYHAPYIMALIVRQTGFRGGLGTAHKPYKPREHPPVQFMGQPAQQEQQEEDAPGAAAQEEGQVTLAQIFQNQQLILNNLQEMRASQLEIRTAQLTFQEETNSRFAALTECVNSLGPWHYTRRRRNSPPRPPSTSAAAPLAPGSPPPVAATQDQASVPAQDQVPSSSH